MFLKANLHGVKEKRRVAAPPFAHTTSLSHVLKRAIWVLFLAGSMILDVALYSLKKCGGWGGRSPAVRKWTASMTGLKSSITVVRVKPVLLMVRCS